MVHAQVDWGGSLPSGINLIFRSDERPSPWRIPMYPSRLASALQRAQCLSAVMLTLYLLSGQCNGEATSSPTTCTVLCLACGVFEPPRGPGGGCEKTFSRTRVMHVHRRFCIQLPYNCHTNVYKYGAHSRASCAAVLKRFASRLKLF